LLYSMCLHGRAELGLAPDEYAALTMVLLRLLAFKPAAGNSASKGASAESAEKKSLTPANQPATSALAQSAAPTHAVPQTPSNAAPATAAPVRPESVEGKKLVQAEKFIEYQPVSSVNAANTATKMVAIPVRVQSEPSGRTEQRTERSSINAAIAPAELVLTPEGDMWHSMVQQLLAAESIAALVRELALQSQLLARTVNDAPQPHDWLLRIERESLSQSGTPEKLQMALASIGQSVRLSIEIGPASDTPAKRIAAAAAEKQRMAQEIITQDDYVQKLMRDFGAKIVPNSIHIT